jgi:hypothetical protein
MPLILQATPQLYLFISTYTRFIFIYIYLGVLTVYLDLFRLITLLKIKLKF